jgi:hypothetical protein
VARTFLKGVLSQHPTQKLACVEGTDQERVVGLSKLRDIGILDWVFKLFDEGVVFFEEVGSDFSILGGCHHNSRIVHYHEVNVCNRLGVGIVTHDVLA